MRRIENEMVEGEGKIEGRGQRMRVEVMTSRRQEWQRGDTFMSVEQKNKVARQL